MWHEPEYQLYGLTHPSPSPLKNHFAPSLSFGLCAEFLSQKDEYLTADTNTSAPSPPHPNAAKVF